MINKWTQKEISFLTINYPLYGKEYCTTKLNREGSSIFKKANRLNIKVNSAVKILNNKSAQEKYQTKHFGLDRKYNKYLILIELYNNSKRTIDTIKKNEALVLYNNGIPITKIIKATGIPSTTLRRLLTTVK